MTVVLGTEIERKFCLQGDALCLSEGFWIAGYASRFGEADQGGDAVAKGAFAASIQRREASNRPVKMLWQHDPACPIGVWDEIAEDDVGLFVKGRLLPDVAQGREAAALIGAGAIDGLSIGYRTLKAEKTPSGTRLLTEVDLWEISLVTFPMLPTARVEGKADTQMGSRQAFLNAISAARAAMSRP